MHVSRFLLTVLFLLDFLINNQYCSLIFKLKKIQIFIFWTIFIWLEHGKPNFFLSFRFLLLAKLSAINQPKWWKLYGISNKNIEIMKNMIVESMNIQHTSFAVGVKKTVSTNGSSSQRQSSYKMLPKLFVGKMFRHSGCVVVVVTIRFYAQSF